MSLLDQLWDDTLAGPRPESGLGKLRKQSSSNFRSSSGKESEGGNSRSYGDDALEEKVRVTRSITIVKPQGNASGTPPISPAGSTPPVSPFAGGREKYYMFRRRSTSDAYNKANAGVGDGVGVGPTTPTSPFNDV